MSSSKQSIRIGIVRLSSFGDVVVSASLVMGFYRALQQRYGEVCIEWFVDTRFAGLLESSSAISTLHALPMKHIKSLRAGKELWARLRALGEFDLVLDLQGLIKSAIIARTLVAKARVGFGFASARESIASALYNERVHIAYDSNILVRNFAIYAHALKLCGIDSSSQAIQEDRASKLIALYCSERGEIGARDFANAVDSRAFGWDQQRAQSLLDPSSKHLLESSAYRVLFVLEASIAQKTYPIESFALLASLMQQASTQTMTFCLIYHEHKDKALSLQAMLEKLGLRVCVLPPLDFNALKYVLSQMHCVIGGDTGVTHLAWGLQCAQVITLLGNPKTTKGKNMRATKLSRVLLGNPYVLSTSDSFEIASIPPESICHIWQGLES